MATVKVELPPKLIPVFSGEADVRGSYGGRGSAKTRSFAKMTAIRAFMWDAEGRSGQILCARQFLNSLADSSMEEIKAAIRSEPWLNAAFEIGEKYIRTRSGRIYYTFVGLDRNIDSVKSKARILLAWVDEAEPTTEESYAKLIPTLRDEGSELWVTWNPESRRSATHKRFRDSKDPRVKIVEMNWRDNPWFPEILNRTRLRDLKERPDSYDHIWEGDFVRIYEGAYFAAGLSQAKREGRITRLSDDPVIRPLAFFDIGGAGANSDATAIWIVQFVRKEIRVLDYIEGQGQVISYYVNEMRDRGWDDAKVYLPHDGLNANNVTGKRYADHWEDAGFDVVTIGNQGRGAAMMRIEAVRRLLPRIWFDEENTEGGREALAAYHEKKDEKRDIGLGPSHDWSSHAADAFGLMAITYEEPSNTIYWDEIERDAADTATRNATTGY